MDVGICFLQFLHAVVDGIATPEVAKKITVFPFKLCASMKVLSSVGAIFHQMGETDVEGIVIGNVRLLVFEGVARQ